MSLPEGLLVGQDIFDLVFGTAQVERRIIVQERFVVFFDGLPVFGIERVAEFPVPAG